MLPGAGVRMVRIVALVVVLSVGTATFSQVAAAQSAPPSPTDAQYEQMLRGAVGPAGDQLVQGLRNLQAGLGIHFGNDALTVAEVRRVGLDPVIEALVELAKLLAQSGQIAGIGFVLAAIFKFWFHKLDPSPVPMIPFVLLALQGRGSPGNLTVDVSGLRPRHVMPVEVSLPGSKHAKARVFLVRKDRNRVIALLGVSTHLGCRLLWPDDPTYGTGFSPVHRAEFEDPCGGSTFARDGACVGGPCPRGLDRYPVKLVDDTAEIDLKHLVTGTPRGASQ